MQGLQSLLSSEHGVFGILLIIAGVVLTILKIMTIDQFQDFAKWIFGTFAVAHIGVSVAGAIKRPGVASEEKKS